MIVSFDYISLILALVAVYFWIVIKDPMASIILVMLADFFGLIPTIRKSYVYPYSETIATYYINTFRLIIATFALEKFTFLTSSYHFYMIAGNLMMVTMLLVRRQQVKKPDYK